MNRRLMQACLLVVVLLGSALLPLVATAQTRYLEFTTPVKSLIPPICSSWQELFPAFGVLHHQDDYVPSTPTGQIAVCDYIKLDGVWYHIDWVGPTYHLSSATAGTIWEPHGVPTGENPVCEQWMQIRPQFGPTFHVDGWSDNGDGVVSICDNVLLGGAAYHIDSIGLNLIVTPGDPVANEESSWGALKRMY